MAACAKTTAATTNIMVDSTKKTVGCILHLQSKVRFVIGSVNWSL